MTTSIPLPHPTVYATSPASDVPTEGEVRRAVARADAGRTLMEETIGRMAGSTNGSRKEVHELPAMAARPAVQRTTGSDIVRQRASIKHR